MRCTPGNPANSPAVHMNATFAEAGHVYWVTNIWASGFGARHRPPVVATEPGMVITTAYVITPCVLAPSGGTNVSDPAPVEIGTPDAPGPTNRDVPPHPTGRDVVHLAVTD
jgi:hypothetical protein